MKRTVSILVCFVICVGAVSFSAFGANAYPQGTISGSINDVSYYCTLDYRGIERVQATSDHWLYRMSGTSQGNGVTSYTVTSSSTSHYLYGDVIHVSMTLRNRNTKIAIADINNFQIRIIATLDGTPDYIEVKNWSNADVYNIDYNPTASSPSLQINFRSTQSLVMMPDEQIDIQFDLILHGHSDGASASVNSLIDGSVSSDFLTLASLYQKPSSFSLYTVEEYSNTFEGFDPFYVRFFSWLKSFLPTINPNPSSQGGTDVSNSSSSASSAIEDIHTSESQWYADNNEAISASGLSNFQFDSTTSTGLSGAVNDFTLVWNSLGTWTLVYTLSLTLSLATFILRHKPRRSDD